MAASSLEPVKCLVIPLVTDLQAWLLVERLLIPALRDYVADRDQLAASSNRVQSTFVLNRLRQQTEEKQARAEQLIKRLRAEASFPLDDLQTPSQISSVDELLQKLRQSFVSKTSIAQDRDFIFGRLADVNLHQIPDVVSNVFDLTDLKQHAAMVNYLLRFFDHHHYRSDADNDGYFKALWSESRYNVVLLMGKGVINNQLKQHELVYDVADDYLNSETFENLHKQSRRNRIYVKTNEEVTTVRAPLAQQIWRRFWHFLKKEWQEKQEPLDRHLILVVDACHAGHLIGELSQWAHQHKLFDLYKMQSSITLQVSCRQTQRARSCYFTPTWLRLNARLFPQSSRELLTECCCDAQQVVVPADEPAQHPCYLTLGSFAHDPFMQGRVKLVGGQSVEESEQQAKRFYQLWTSFCKNYVGGEPRSRGPPVSILPQ